MSSAGGQYFYLHFGQKRKMVKKNIKRFRHLVFFWQRSVANLNSDMNLSPIMTVPCLLSGLKKKFFYSLNSSNSASHPFLTKNKLQLWTQASNSLYSLNSSFLTYLDEICLTHFFVIPQQTQPLLCVASFLSLCNRCWAHLLWSHRKQTSGCASTPYIFSYSSATAHPFVKGQLFSMRFYVFWKQQPYVMQDVLLSCSRVTNAGRALIWQSITNAFPAREVSSTQDVLQSADPAAFVFLIKKNSEREKKNIVWKLVKC